MLGFRNRDTWLQDFEDAKRSADEAMELIQDRTQVVEMGSADTARLTGTIRRKLGGLKSKIESLDGELKEQNVSGQESERRRDMLTRLKTRHDQLSSMLNTNGRRTFAPGDQMRTPPRETEQTAELDNQGLIMMQRNIMQDQDTQLDDLSRIVSSTKHISMAIGEEVDLHNRLLDDLDHDIDTNQWRLKNATRKAMEIYKKSGSCKYMFVMISLVIGLVVLLILLLSN
mmetsp:Transcript_31701/g.69281  ORF Transcript_31701/g.69281 Transcript_31701/m.69281 type:complete len:228 (+) Transcript_31701:122-805(+)|eukprot:CAMPEP_0118927394 /NCGR_PEP_ID=MMETSP1169-20130426/4872_1 /TAXON_ID=36882 /ORGANISM="Pyramimonas obovata, Strain CCMP722" /LENGTH=227 /DNA_ID=CAMNT_0006869141 /DNA_START=100 /DNA_END=783 /DNA_ORIENTATION=-